MADLHSIPCPQCKKIYKVKSEFLGKKVTCKACRHQFTMPTQASLKAYHAQKQIQAVEAQQDLSKMETGRARVTTEKKRIGASKRGGAKPSARRGGRNQNSR
ncbi:MAG: hypothetical protein HQL32_07110 [Planctomycetes bacterium]|nr:hypothetical protein [Planctomycetota bacterium]